MSKKYQLSITAGYCHDWTVENAVRELFQNQLDSPAEGTHDYDGATLTITNKNISIPTKTLLMGITSKRADDDSVGGKGEGFKLACGILLREGCSVEILNGGVKWTPVFEYNHDFEEQVLVVYETPLPGNTDLTFIVEGIDEDTMDNIVEENIYLRNDITDVLECSMGAVIKDFGGKVFVGGLYVCDEPRLAYSYDFHPSQLKLNRDRKSVDDWDLRMQTSKLLCEVLDVDAVVDLLEGGVFDIKSAEYHAGEEVHKACFEKFRDSSEEQQVVASWEEDKGGLESRYEAKATILRSQPFANIVSKSVEYSNYLSDIEKEDYEEDDRTPLDILEELKGVDAYCDDEELQEVYQQIYEIFNKRGVSWDDTSIEIPF